MISEAGFHRKLVSFSTAGPKYTTPTVYRRKSLTWLMVSEVQSMAKWLQVRDMVGAEPSGSLLSGWKA